LRPTGPERRAALLGASVTLPKHVVHRAFATETVILNLRTGMYHGLNPTGARMLDALERNSTVSSAASELANVYGIGVHEIENDLCDLCSQLLERGLIDLHDGGEG
jgi:hypothetical protein